jgi:ATP phosphoribosyltransferase regulatory subunit
LVSGLNLWHTFLTMLEQEALTQHIAHIPRGVADYFWQEAQERRMLEAALLETFRRWGYGDVIPPMFEFADVLNARASAKLQSQLIRFLDWDGSTVALRPEMTIAVARLVATRLHDRPMPQRFCYAGSVFRNIETQGGRQREFRQAGVELIGAARPQADAEVLALTVEAMQVAGLNDFRLVIGQLQFYTGLLKDLNLDPVQQQALHQAINRNSAPALEEFLRDVPLRTQQRRTVEELPLLSGRDPESVINSADRLSLNYTMHAALENLRSIVSNLDAHGMADRVILDLTEINDLGYYTGLTFEALVPGQGFSLAGGGRYDHLVGTFGDPQPAVGVALGVDRLLLASRSQRDKTIGAEPCPPQILINTGNSAACLQWVRCWRKQGIRVKVDVCNLDGPKLWETAQRMEIPTALAWSDNGLEVYEGNAQQQPVRIIAAEDAHTLAQLDEVQFGKDQNGSE